MQHIQDKEFDQLFKDQLGDAEVEPSAELWANIASELEPRRKRSFPLYWLAAAVALLVVGVTFLSSETEKIRLQAPSQIAGNMAADAVLKPSRPETLSSVKPAPVAQGTPLVISPRLTAEEIKKNMIPLQPLVVNHRQDNGTAPQELVIAQEIEHPKEEVMMARAEIVEQAAGNDIREASPSERRGIRNVGDLVNYVVDRVDKRENKVLKFDTDDDDNSSLIAINIGFIRLNSKRHK